MLPVVEGNEETEVGSGVEEPPVIRVLPDNPDRVANRDTLDEAIDRVLEVLGIDVGVNLTASQNPATGIAAASPSAQMVLPMIFCAT